MGDTEIALREPQNADLPTLGARTGTVAPIVCMPIEQLAALRDRLKQFKDVFLERGEEPGEGDYGMFPGTDREVLYQSGARKYQGFLQLIDRPRQTKCVENFEQGFFHYEYSTDLVSRVTGEVVATGVGSANSMEKKWRFRLAERKCPECGASAIMKSKWPDRDRPNDPPGWYCFAKRGGCGANFRHDDERITKQELGQVPNDDVQSQVHTILRIAAKRAHSHAVVSILSMCGFNIDAGDDDDDHDGDADRSKGRKGKDAKGGNGSGEDRVTEAEQKTLMETATKAGHKVEDIRRWLLEVHQVDLSKGRVPKALLATLTERLAKKDPLTAAGGESGKLGRGF